LTLENPVPSQAGHLTSEKASLDFDFFIKLVLQRNEYYPFSSRTPTPLPPLAGMISTPTFHNNCRQHSLAGF
jgi:hypothetical protein